jgi:replicative superfamily II helicase
MSSSAKLVVVMGTQYYDGSGLGASDYHVTDLLQMLGRASRPGIDEVRSTAAVAHNAQENVLFAVFCHLFKNAAVVLGSCLVCLFAD